jgi:tetratricopeptide (TPR) repeat protein
LPALSKPSYSAKILALYAAEYLRDRAFAGTSGSGTWLFELIGGSVSSLALGPTFQQLIMPHTRLTQRDLLDCHRTALASARIDGHREGEAGTLNILAHTHFALRNFDQAATYLNAALQLNQSGDSPVHHRAVLLNNLGAVHLEQGNTDSAIDLYKQALRLCRDAARHVLDVGEHRCHGLGIGWPHRRQRRGAVAHHRGGDSMLRQWIAQPVPEDRRISSTHCPTGTMPATAVTAPATPDCHAIAKPLQRRDNDLRTALPSSRGPGAATSVGVPELSHSHVCSG